MTKFQRLVRFIANDGKIYTGDAILPRGVDDAGRATHAHVIEGSIFGQHNVTNNSMEIKKLLCPLAREQLRTVRCLGLNYEQHAHESNMPIPKFPVVFHKPLTAIGGPFDDIPVPKMAQEEESVDYECELVVVIGKEAKNVSEKDALNYVLGYAVGNDVSHRDWQLKKGGGQWTLGKMFDGWAPMGPAVVSNSIIKDPQSLKISTTLNGKVVQNSTTADQIFGVAKTIAFLSQGCSLLPGDLIFTGTPQGVGSGRKPQLWLRDGDVVEVGLEGCGKVRSKVVFEKASPKSKL